MSEPRTCGNCGAAAARLAERFCGFCGHEFPREVAPAAPPSLHGDVPARLAAVRDSPAWDRARDETPSDSHVRNGLLFRMVFGFIFAGIGGVVAGGFVLSIIGIPFAVVPIAFVGIGLWISYDAMQKQSRFASARLQRVPALVVDERVKVSGGGKNSSATTNYFASLEFEDGSRVELQASGPVAGRIAQGDVGVAFVREKHLLDFTRVRV